MRITCNRCGKAVSQEVPDDTLVRAWVECPECVSKECGGEFDYLNNKELLDRLLNTHYVYTYDVPLGPEVDKLTKEVLRRMGG